MKKLHYNEKVAYYHLKDGTVLTNSSKGALVYDELPHGYQEIYDSLQLVGIRSLFEFFTLYKDELVHLSRTLFKRKPVLEILRPYDFPTRVKLEELNFIIVKNNALYPHESMTIRELASRLGHKQFIEYLHDTKEFNISEVLR